MERDDAYADLWFCCQSGMHLKVISTSFQILLINQFKHTSSGKEKQAMLPLHTLLSPSAPICCCTSITEINQFNPDRQGVRGLLLQRKVKRCSYSLSQVSTNSTWFFMLLWSKLPDHCDLPKSRNWEWVLELTGVIFLENWNFSTDHLRWRFLLALTWR